MSKFIKLTNNYAEHKGNPIYINIDHISSIFDEILPDGMSHTFVFSVKTGTVWDVEETSNDIVKKIKDIGCEIQ